jgi:hypothetical protein
MTNLPSNRAQKTRLFKGKDKYDLDQQLWEWRSTHPQAFNVKEGPDNWLPISFRPILRFAKIVYPDLVSRLIEYDENEKHNTKI